MKELREVPGLNPEDAIVIKKFTYGDKSKLAGKCAKLDLKNPNSVDIDIGEYKIWAIVYGVEKAPFFGVGIDKYKAVENLPAETGDFLFNEVTQYNNLGDISELKKK
ncbi:MAG: hypothetical protein ACOYWZ_17395 [Bacillota bacterium]